MKLHRRRRTHHNNERWLVSYADFITLLFAFFVLLYASSQADKEKMARLSEAIESAFSKLGASATGTAAPRTSSSADSDTPVALISPASSEPPQTGPPEQLRAALERTLAREIENHTAAVRQSPDGLVVSLREVGFFSSGSATLRSEAEPAVARIVSLLREQPFRIRVEGHTDNVPIHTKDFDSNWELSTARATFLIRRFVTVYRVPPERLSAAGFAEFHPIASNDTAQGRSLNRRIDLVVLPDVPAGRGR